MISCHTQCKYKKTILLTPFACNIEINISTIFFILAYFLYSIGWNHNEDHLPCKLRVQNTLLKCVTVVAVTIMYNSISL